MQTNTALWQAINAYDLDAADAVFPFSRRLARDNGWSHSFASRAITEYKRFMYLICVSGHTLTPSDEVDCVWHLHLIYTQDYWDSFCGGVLGRKVHHGPTKGGQAESDKYLTCYQRTLDLYRTEFGSEPPPAQWPGEQARFDSPERYQRIDMNDKIVLPKRQVFLCLAAGACLVVAACDVKAAVQHFDWKTWLFLGFIGLVFWTSLRSFFRARPRRRNRRGTGYGDSSGCGGAGGAECGHHGDGGGHGCSGSDGGSGCGGGGCGGGGD